MESFVLAETLKYAALALTAPRGAGPGDFHVFSTEGHLLPVLPRPFRDSRRANRAALGGEASPPPLVITRSEGCGGAVPVRACDVAAAPRASDTAASGTLDVSVWINTPEDGDEDVCEILCETTSSAAAAEQVQMRARLCVSVLMS